MGIFSKFFSKKKNDEYYENSSFYLSEIIDNDEDRKKYIEGIISQMKASGDDIDSLSREYDKLTSLLGDIEQIDSFPRDIREDIMGCARALNNVENVKATMDSNLPYLSESEYAIMTKSEPDMPKAYNQILDAENYQKKIRSDLQYVESEKNAYKFRLREMETMISNLGGALIIITICFLTGVAIEIIFALMLSFDVKIAFLITVAAAAIGYTIVAIKVMERQEEKRVIERDIARLVQLHNTVKIRYVNNTNLLDYYYIKYNVASSSELDEIWSRYIQVRDERMKMMKTQEEWDYYSRELSNKLRRLHIQDPEVWKYQTNALLNPKEMVEVRHHLVGQRQALRKKMDESKAYAMAAEEELKKLLKAYPKYSTEVMTMMEKYESKVSI